MSLQEVPVSPVAERHVDSHEDSESTVSQSQPSAAGSEPSGSMLHFLMAPARHIPSSDLFEVTVKNPHRIRGDGGAYGGYISYDVKTVDLKTDSNHLVVRRYSDFDWLHEQLCLEYPCVIIPPLPEKTVLNRFTAQVVEYRRRELERFLRRVVAHSQLGSNPMVTTFLKADDADFQNGKGGSKVGQSAPVGEDSEEDQKKKASSGFMGKLGSGLRQIGSSISSVGSSISSMIPIRSEPDLEPFFEAKRQKYDFLVDKLTQTATSISFLLRKWQGIQEAYSELGSMLEQLSSIEKEYKCPSLAKMYSQTSLACAHVHCLTEELVQQKSTHFEENIKDYIREAMAVKRILDNRSAELSKVQDAERLSEQKALAYGKMKGNPKEEKAFEEATIARKAVEERKKEFEEISACCREEVTRFETQQCTELQQIFLGLSKLNMEFSMQVASLWKEVFVAIGQEVSCE